MEKDVEGTLAALAKIGYREVELAGLHGRTARAMRGMLDRLALVAPASHVPIEAFRRERERVFEEASTLGNQYVIIPWLDSADRKTLGDYQRVAALFNEIGIAAKQAGLQLAYHNHDFEFQPLGGTVPYDVLLAECDPELVKMELDLFWITKGGRDPLVYFAKHPGRFLTVHVKDMAPGGQMVDVGAGSIDFSKIFAQSERAGIRHYFVEHDEPPSPLDSARRSYMYLRRLTW